MENREQKIKEWKEKHGEVYGYTAGEKECFLKKPNRKVLAAAATVGKNDPIRYNEILLNGCWLGGDEEIKTDDAYFLGVSAKLAELVEVKEGELKKL